MGFLLTVAAAYMLITRAQRLIWILWRVALAVIVALLAWSLALAR